MNKKITRLISATVFLFLLSLVIHFNEHKRGSDLVSGSDFIAGLDIEKISRIKVRKGSEELIFAKEGNLFLIENKKSYPAASEKINDLLFNISNIQITEKISGSSSSHKEYKVSSQAAEAVVSLFDRSETKILDFYIGRSYKGRGNYIRKEGSDDVYLSKTVVSFPPEKNAYINKRIVNLKEIDISKVQTVAGKKSLSVVRDGSEFVVVGLSKNKIDPAKVKTFVRNTMGIDFVEYLLPDDEKVKSLNFSKETRIELNNKLTYQLLFAKKQDKYYMKARSITEEMPNKVVIDQNAGKDEISKIDALIKSQGVARKFNASHARWIYEISKGNYENYTKGPKDLVKM